MNESDILEIRKELAVIQQIVNDEITLINSRLQNLITHHSNEIIPSVKVETNEKQ